MKKILIIDDSTFAIRVLTDILKDTYEVISAGNGRDGIALAGSELPALILLDIEMPGMDGFEVLNMLKEDGRTKPIPVIFLTGVIDSAYEERGFLCGVVDYIVKPYNHNVVKVRVKTHIDLAEYSRQIESQLNLDMLTDIYNRRGLEEYTKKAAKKALEEQSVFNCIMFDVDFFKRVNDTYGHLQGDRVLSQVASVLKECVPENEGCVARYGGEEFTVILPDKTEEEIKEVINQVYEKIHNIGILNEKSDVSKYLTISAGGAGMKLKNPESAEAVIRLADEMLYISKREGRDRFTWYGDLKP